MAVWQECYFRWEEISKMYPLHTNARDDGRAAMMTRPLGQEELHNQWRNLSLFLAAFGGVCMPDEPYEHDALSQYIPAEYMPDSAVIIHDPDAMLDKFLQQMVMLLLAPDAIVRDVAREVLGSELNPRLFSKLYRKVEE
jgi:hypothetical protein